MSRGQEDDRSIADMMRQALDQSAQVNAALLAELRAMREQQAADNKPSETLDYARKRLLAVIEAEKLLPSNPDGTHYIEEDRIPCQSDRNGFADSTGKVHGATFVAVVQRGRTIRFDAYRVPEAAYVPKSEGGLCPWDRSKMFHPNTATPTNELGRLIYETYYRRDAEMFVGFPPKYLPVLPPDQAPVAQAAE